MSVSRLRQRIELSGLISKLGRRMSNTGSNTGSSAGSGAGGVGSAGGDVRIEGELALSELPRLKMLLADGSSLQDGPGSTSGSPFGPGAKKRVIKASLDFWRDASGLVVIDGAIGGMLPLQCQRCLVAFDWQLEHRFRVALQDSESGSRAPQELEILDGVGDSIVPADLIEEEILLAMPLVPSHLKKEDCGPLVEHLADVEESAHADSSEAGETARPFAGLQSLLPAKDK